MLKPRWQAIYSVKFNDWSSHILVMIKLLVIMLIIDLYNNYENSAKCWQYNCNRFGGRQRWRPWQLQRCYSSADKCVPNIAINSLQVQPWSPTICDLWWNNPHNNIAVFIATTCYAFPVCRPLSMPNLFHNFSQISSLLEQLQRFCCVLARWSVALNSLSNRDDQVNTTGQLRLGSCAGHWVVKNSSLRPSSWTSMLESMVFSHYRSD